MSEKEKAAAQELINSYKALPDEGKDKVRTYIAGIRDGLNIRTEKDERGN